MGVAYQMFPKTGNILVSIDFIYQINSGIGIKSKVLK